MRRVLLFCVMRRLDRYISRVPDGDLIEMLARNADSLIGLIRAQPPELADYAYAEGKWTVKEVIGHLCDAERLFAYRLLHFARGDQAPLPGFDQEAYAAAAVVRGATCAGSVGTSSARFVA